MSTASATTGVTGHQTIGGFDLQNLRADLVGEKKPLAWGQKANMRYAETLGGVAYGIVPAHWYEDKNGRQQPVRYPTDMSMIAMCLLRDKANNPHTACTLISFHGSKHWELEIGNQRYRQQGGRVHKK